jgi:hypothetical protein
MFLVDLLFALVVALLLTAVFSLGFRNPGPWGVWWVFLLVIFLAAWAGGVWVTPFGPPLFDTYWLPILFVGLFFALLLAAIPPYPRPTYEPGVPPAGGTAEGAAVALGTFFWVLILGFALVIILAYV